MRLDAKAFGLATGITAGMLFILCAFAVAIAPESTTAFAGYLIHVDLTGLSRTLTFGSFVGGLLAWTAGTAVTFWISALIYNRLAGIVAPKALRDHQPVAQRA
jgi:hypothetical protein